MQNSFKNKSRNSKIEFWFCPAVAQLRFDVLNVTTITCWPPFPRNPSWFFALLFPAYNEPSHLSINLPLIFIILLEILSWKTNECHHDFSYSRFHFSLPLIFINLISIKKSFLVKGGLGSKGIFNLIWFINEPNHYPLPFWFKKLKNWGTVI